MSEKNNATCSICGKPYHVCMSCKDSIELNPWKIHCCSSEHYKVFQIIRGLSTNVYTRDEVREKLKKVDLHDLESYRPHIKSLIKDILKESNSKSQNNKVKLSVDDINSVGNMTFSHKKNYKKLDTDKSI